MIADSNHAPSSPPSGSTPSAGGNASPSPWVETRAGGLFFVNALLVGPAFVVLFPLSLISMLRGAGIVGAEWSVLDTLPTLAGYLVPWIGWLALVPAGLCVRNLRMGVPRPAAWALRTFVLVHLGFVGWGVASWL